MAAENLTPEALAERERILRLCREQIAIYERKMEQALERDNDEKFDRSMLFKDCIEWMVGWIESGKQTHGLPVIELTRSVHDVPGNRELLTAAAKAVGMPEAGIWRRSTPAGAEEFGISTGDVINGRLWNPLESDGEALRMLPFLSHSLAETIELQFTDEDVFVNGFAASIKEHGGDRAEALRFAIVGFAAAVGRAKHA